MSDRKAYKEDVVIFGKVECDLCGSNVDLLRAEINYRYTSDDIMKGTKKGEFIKEGYRIVTRCKTCLNDLPSLENNE